ncbi:Uncharacterised protein [Metamycoplasma cloacale]|uniref:Uncharacterized protein n=1 Tax=Metamycoplasma cloacale TaxID=92401 RepID=A0A2Z4LLI5_9BACT|nr:HNH endonuclease [Metamycoplasma cloacale]AWX42583.1 hypothetical protein DK849_00590 [Metamycoplasma cloacale]VEU79698.1 Uncharacterised protein [Metamycoplasma cloacale]
MNLKPRYYKLEFQTKNLHIKSHSAKASGYIYIYGQIDNNSKEVSLTINDVKVEFNYLLFDTYHTASHFQNKNAPKYFEMRQNFCNENNIEFKARSSNKNNNLIEFTNELLSKFNLETNNYLKKSTLKSLISLIKGNNPCGSITKPQNSEIIIVNKDDIYFNIPILIDCIWYKTSETRKIDYSNKEFNNFFQDIMAITELKNFFLSLESKIDDSLTKEEQRKSAKRNLLRSKQLISLQTVITKYRSFFSTNIEKQLKRKSLMAFDNDNFEKCHIYDVQLIKKDILNKWNNKQISEPMEIETHFKEDLFKIQDFYNFINLSPNLHALFDSRKICFSPETGELIENNQYSSLLNEEKIKFNKINEDFLHKCRKYLYDKNLAYKKDLDK